MTIIVPMFDPEKGTYINLMTMSEIHKQSTKGHILEHALSKRCKNSCLMPSKESCCIACLHNLEMLKMNAKHAVTCRSKNNIPLNLTDVGT